MSGVVRERGEGKGGYLRYMIAQLRLGSGDKKRYVMRRCKANMQKCGNSRARG